MLRVQLTKFHLVLAWKRLTGCVLRVNGWTKKATDQQDNMLVFLFCVWRRRSPYFQVLLYLLRRCYGLIYKLLSASEPVSEELMPIANKLGTVKKCLNEVLKYGGPFSPRDLYPVSSISLRHRSKF